MSDPPYKYKADNYFDSDVEKGIKKIATPTKKERRALPCYHSHSYTVHTAYLSRIYQCVSL